MRRLFLSLVVAAAGTGCSTLPANPCGELIRSGDRCVCPPGSTADEVEPWVCHLPDGGTIRDPNAPGADGGIDVPDHDLDAGPNTDDAATCTPSEEICNGLDDDCSGEADDAFDCVLGSPTQSCTTSCGSTGTQGCTDSCAWEACEPPAEVCNHRDDDCDGFVDEGLASWSDTPQVLDQRGSTGTLVTTAEHLVYVTGPNDGLRYRVLHADGGVAGPTRSVPNVGGSVLAFDAKPVSANTLAIAWIARSGTNDTVYLRTYAVDASGTLVGEADRVTVTSWTTEYCDAQPGTPTSSCPSYIQTLGTESTNVAMAVTTNRVYVLHALRHSTSWAGSTITIDPGYSAASGANGYALQVSAHRTEDLRQESQFSLPFSTWRMAWGTAGTSSGATINDRAIFAFRQPASTTRGICTIGIPTDPEDNELVEGECWLGTMIMSQISSGTSRGLLLTRRGSHLEAAFIDGSGAMITDDATGSLITLDLGPVDSGRRRFDLTDLSDGWDVGFIRDGRWVLRPIRSSGAMGSEVVGPSVVVDSTVSVGRSSNGPLVAASASSPSAGHRLHRFGCFGD